MASGDQVHGFGWSGRYEYMRSIGACVKRVPKIYIFADVISVPYLAVEQLAWKRGELNNAEDVKTND